MYVYRQGENLVGTNSFDSIPNKNDRQSRTKIKRKTMQLYLNEETPNINKRHNAV